MNLQAFGLVMFGISAFALLFAFVAPRVTTRRRVKPRADLKLVFINQPAPAAPEEIVVDDLGQQQLPIHATSGAEPETVEAAPPLKRGRLLGFGASRRQPELVVEDSGVQTLEEPADVVEVAAPKKRLFGGLRGLFVRRAEPLVQAEPVEDEWTTGDVEPLVVQQHDAGSIELSPKGEIIETPADGGFPVDRFETADGEHDRLLETEAEQRAALEAAEQAKLDAAHRRELELVAARDAKKAAEAQRTQDAADAAHRREMELLQAQAAARVEADERASLWYVRLDPDAVNAAEGDRLKMVGSLESVRAPWAGKLLVCALGQDDSERVRARALGALARGGHRASGAPFIEAASRSDVERWALVEALTPFADESEWIAGLLADVAAGKFVPVAHVDDAYDEQLQDSVIVDGAVDSVDEVAALVGSADGSKSSENGHVDGLKVTATNGVVATAS
jgi:hypothetical protein